MKIDKIMSFLTHPGKHIDKQPEVNGVEIPNEGNLYNMLFNIFENSESDRKIMPIVFISGNSQNNSVRDKVVRLVSTKSMEDGKILSKRLQCFTPEKAGRGLIFFIIGSSGDERKIVISRFPAQEGIFAKQQFKSLEVEHVEEVFMKISSSYKSAIYKFNISNHDLWSGFAIDKQVNDVTKGVAAYWIKDFLGSDFETTPQLGTARLARALQDAIAHTHNMRIKEEIVSCAKLADNISNEAMSINKFCDRFHLSSEAKEEVSSHVSTPSLSDDIFLFDKSEFAKHLSYKMIELDNGAMLSAQAVIFDECFQVSLINDNKVRYVTSGKVVDEKLKRSK